MQCESCGAPIPIGSQYCASCGSRVRLACRSCGEPIRPGLKFCTSCGTSVGYTQPFQAARPAPPSTAAPPYYDPPTQHQVNKGRGSPLLFWLPFGILLSLGAILFWGAGASPEGWAAAGACFLLLFLLRNAIVRAGAVAAVAGWIALAAGLLLVLGMSIPAQGSRASASSTSSSSAAAPRATTAAMPARPKVEKLAVGLGLDRDQRILNPTSNIKPGTPEVFLSLEVHDVSGETAVQIVWVYLETGDSISGPVQRISDDQRLGFSLTRPTRGWPAGSFRAVVLLNGAEASAVDFSVRQ